MDDQIQRIKYKILDKSLEMNGCLSVLEVEHFESTYGITLPESYRRFILEVGNGGAGPSIHGVSRLGEAPDYLNPEYQQFHNKRVQTSLSKLQQPFPFQEIWVWEDEDWAEEELRKEKEKLELGNLLIGDSGCAMYWHLIISGSETSNIWEFTDVGIVPMNQNFLCWYEDWLDQKGYWAD